LQWYTDEDSEGDDSARVPISWNIEARETAADEWEVLGVIVDYAVPRINNGRVGPLSVFAHMYYDSNPVNSAYYGAAGHDTVTVHSCSTADCSHRQQLATVAGNLSDSDSVHALKAVTHTSMTGFLEVTFSSMGSSIKRVGTNGCAGVSGWKWLNVYPTHPLACVSFIAGDPTCNQNIFRWVGASGADHGNCGCTTELNAVANDCSIANNGYSIYKVLPSQTTSAAGFKAALFVGESCAACALGTFRRSNSTTSPDCSVCRVGSYSNVLGATSCRTCAPGSYSGLQVRHEQFAYSLSWEEARTMATQRGGRLLTLDEAQTYLTSSTLYPGLMWAAVTNAASTFMGKDYFLLGGVGTSSIVNVAQACGASSDSTCPPGTLLVVLAILSSLLAL